MKKPFVSVVMSVYNGEKYLDESIESILNQSYAYFEFIIIDDGSTDKSLSIIKRYKEHDDRIILISRENRGLIASLNEGIYRAKGKYIARMDADDVSFSNRFEKQVAFMEHNPDIGVCGTAVIGFDESEKNRPWILSSNDKTLRTELLFSSSLAHPSVMMRRELIMKYNLFYDEDFKHAEDFELWTRMIDFTKLANLQVPLLKYRVLENSITREADKENETRFYIIKAIFKTSLKRLNIENSDAENKLHFNLTVNVRMKEAAIHFDILEQYFDKLVQANKKTEVYNSFELNKILGKKWLWNFYYHKNLKGFFSSYFFYGIWSILSK